MVGGEGEGSYFVALIDELMSSSDELEAVHVVEFSGYFVSEQPSCAAGGDCPGSYVFRVAPYQVTESAFVGDLLRASYDADLVEGADFGA